MWLLRAIFWVFFILKQRLPLPEGRADITYEALEQQIFLFIIHIRVVTVKHWIVHVLSLKALTAINHRFSIE